MLTWACFDDPFEGLQGFIVVVGDKVDVPAPFFVIDPVDVVVALLCCLEQRIFDAASTLC